MQRFIVRPVFSPSMRIYFKLLNEKSLQVTVILGNKSHEHYKQKITDQNFPQNLKELFESTKQLYDYLKNQKAQTIVFVPGQSPQDHKNQYPLFISNENRIEFEVKAHKTLKKCIQLNPMQASQSEQFYLMVLSQISQLQKIEEVKRRISEKQIKIKLLEKSLSEINEQVSAQKTQIKQRIEALETVCQDVQNKQKQIANIRSQYEQRYMHKVDLKKLNLQIEQENQRQVFENESEVIPPASMIYEALPKECQRHPMGKHIEFHNGKKTLYLKNKQISDIDIQGMLGFDWDSIDILSLGANHLTNWAINSLNDCSEWPNVRQLYLFGNKITDITQLKFIRQLQILSLYDLQLNQASCQHLLSAEFPRLKQIYLNFDKGVVEQCWKKIVASQFQCFPKLQSVTMDNPQNISSETRVLLNKLCQRKNVKMSLGTPSGKQYNLY